MRLVRRSAGVLLALLALGALVASAAQASTFNSEKEATVVTGAAKTVQSFAPETGATAVECKKAHFEGTVSGSSTSEHVTVRPEYSECNYGAYEAFVNSHTCHYSLGPNTNEEGHATVDVVKCPTETISETDEGPMEITIPNLGIKFRIGEQSKLYGVHYTNTPEEGEAIRTIDVEATVHGIVYHCEPAFICALGGVTPTGENGVYLGTVEVEGLEDLNEGTTGNYETGEQVGIWWAE